jgi:hypothetical protein
LEAKVPQRIDMEDKVIGPLTLGQFFYLLFGGLFIYLLNAWTAHSLLRLLFYPAALIIGVGSIMLAFVKVQDRPFVFFLLSLVEFMRRPKTRYWMQGDHQKLTKIVANKKAVEEAAPHKEFDRERVSDLAKVIDTQAGADQKGPGL